MLVLGELCSGLFSPDLLWILRSKGSTQRVAGVEGFFTKKLAANGVRTLSQVHLGRGAVHQERPDAGGQECAGDPRRAQACALPTLMQQPFAPHSVGLAGSHHRVPYCSKSGVCGFLA